MRSTKACCEWFIFKAMLLLKTLSTILSFVEWIGQFSMQKFECVFCLSEPVIIKRIYDISIHGDIFVAFHPIRCPWFYRSPWIILLMRHDQASDLLF
jgi:hypothetical protein